MIFKLFWSKLSYRERLILVGAASLFVLSFPIQLALKFQESSVQVPIRGGFYREGLVGQPITVNPITSYNPVDQDLSALIYTPLSLLASNIEIKKDGRIYTVKIQENLKWSNNQPLTADDIIFTIETIQNPSLKSPLSKNWEGVNVERLSELQVQFTFKEPYAFFSHNINKLYLIPKHVFGAIPAENFKLSEYNLEPVGNGPYKFKSFTKRKDGFITQYRLVTNENYHKEKPFIKDFYFSFFENQDDLLRAFRFRQIDGFGLLTPNLNLKNFQGSNIKTMSLSRYYAIFMNDNANPLLKNERFRNALNDLINRKKITDEVFDQKLTSKLNNSIFLFKSNSSEKNLSESKQVISNFKNSYGKISLTLITPKLPFLEKAAEIIKTDWLIAGLDEVKIIAVKPEEILKNVIKINNYELLLFGNSLENPEDIFPFWHSSQISYPGLNLSAYQNSKADQIMEKIRTTPDPQDRAEYLKDLIQIITNEKPAIFLFAPPYLYIHNNHLKGFNPTNEEIITAPPERFKKIKDWHVITARVLKQKTAKTQEIKNSDKKSL